MNFLPIGSTIKSVDSRIATGFDVFNNTGKTLTLYWIDQAGVELPYGKVQPNESFNQRLTYSGHVWELKSEDGSIAFKFQLDAQRGLIDVEKSGPVFDPYLQETIDTPLGQWDTYNGYGLIDAAKSLGVKDIGYALPIGGPNNNLELDLVKAPSAWAAGFTGKDVIVAEIDIGIAPHPEISMVAGYDFYQNDSDPTPDAGLYADHGIGVAGIIAGRNDFHAGPDVTGVAPDAKIMSLRTGSSTGNNSVGFVISSIRWAVDHSAKVICIPQGNADTHFNLPELTEAVNYAYAHNSLVVFAGGNDSIYGAAGLALLAKEGKCIAVGNLDVTAGSLFASSNMAGETPFPWVLAASSGYTAAPDGGYKYFSDGGTSFASPYVAGLAALLYQQNPNATTSEIINKIIYGAARENAGHVIQGDAKANTLQNTAAADKVDGGAGLDTLVYHGHRADFIVKASTAGFSVEDKLTGTIDTLSNIERITFDDAAVALDVGANSHAGAVYRMYQTCLNRAPDLDGLGFWTGLLDSGMDLKAVASGFINSQEFQKLYGVNVSDETFITNLYKNVLHRAPDAEGFAWHLKALGAGVSRVDEVIGFSESAENIAQLIGVMQNGVDFHLSKG